MNATELKRNHEQRGGEFFSRENLAVHGDTVKNFMVQPFPISLGGREVWVLKRKARTHLGAPVAHFYFDTQSFQLVLPV